MSFNNFIVAEKLKGLVGYRQPFNPDFTVLDSDLTSSESELFVNDNPFAKLEYLKDAQDYVDITDIQFNDFLRTKIRSSIISVCNAVFNKAVYIDRQVLYKNAFNKTELSLLPDGFIGYKIQVSSEKNISFNISRVLLDFSGSGDLELLLFNTAKKEPIFTQVVSISSDHESIELNWKVDNSADTYKGDYYFGYLSNYPDKGTLQPYDKNYQTGDIQSYVTHLCIEKGSFNGMNSNLLPDLKEWNTISETTGLNPDTTVLEDFTDLIVNNKSLFSKAIWYDLQISVLAEIAASIRSNRNQRMGKDMFSKIIAEIEGADSGDGLKITGIRPKYYGAIKTISKEIEELQAGYFGDDGYITTMQ